MDTWYHIAGAFDGSVMKLYVNGSLQATETYNGDVTPGDGVALLIGDNPTWPNRYFQGKLDEIRIWSVNRTAEEILNNMAVELNGNEAGLVAYYPMNEGSGTVVGDASGNENNGTMLNMDETAWVDGFEAAGQDVGVLGIASPSIFVIGFTSTEYVKI